METFEIQPRLSNNTINKIVSARDIALDTYSDARQALAVAGRLKGLYRKIDNETSIEQSDDRLITRSRIAFNSNNIDTQEIRSNQIVISDETQDYFFVMQPVQPISVPTDPSQRNQNITFIEDPLPPSIIFTPTFSKNIVRTPLVDGITLFERVNYNPVEIECNITFVKDDNTSVIAINNLTYLLRSLYKNDDILEIINPYINSLEIFYGIVTEIDFIPTRGGKLNKIRFKLLEVDVNTQILVRT